MDPNKLFIGNLHYDATESHIRELFATYWGVPVDVVDERIESIKVIRDWKTGKSKGFGFLQFYEPMVATSTMVSMNQAKNSGSDKKRGGGWKIMGRTVRLDQGVRNREEEEKEIQRKKAEKEKKKKERMARAELDEEGKVILDALEGVDGVSDKKEEEEDGMMSEDDMITFMEKGGLRGVMPLTLETAGFLGIKGMYEDDDEEDEYYSEFYGDNGYNDEDWGVDLDDDEEDLENFVFDGDFEAEYNPNEYEALSEDEEAEMKKMNREQRRAAEKRRKKRKLPFKGFGTPN
jgi:hypothetical protein